MRFNDIINGLEKTCLEMCRAAELAEWDSVAALDRRRIHLLAALGSADEHSLTTSTRNQITHIVTLDQQIIQLIREGRASAQQRAAREAHTRDHGAAMYEQLRHTSHYSSAD